MNILNTWDELQVEFASLLLRETSMSNNEIEKLTAIAVLHDHVKFFISLDDFIKLDNVGVPNFLEDFYLPGDSLHIFLILNLVFFKDLNSYFLPGESVLPKFDLTESTLSKMFAY